MIKNIKIMEFLKMAMILVIIFFLLNFNSVDLNITSESVNQNNTITISGKAEKDVIPNTARISFSVNEYKKDQKDAAEIVNKKTKDIVEALRELGVDEKDIKTTNYSVSPQYNWVENKRIFKDYRASQSVEFKIVDLENIPKILAKIVELNVDNLTGPNMFVDNLDEIKNSLRKEAIDDAKKKAKVLASELGISLDKIVSFSESGNTESNPPVYYAKAASFEMVTADFISEPEINPGEEKIVKTVNITFKIKD